MDTKNEYIKINPAVGYIKAGGVSSMILATAAAVAKITTVTTKSPAAGLKAGVMVARFL